MRFIEGGNRPARLLVLSILVLVLFIAWHLRQPHESSPPLSTGKPATGSQAVVTPERRPAGINTIHRTDGASTSSVEDSLVEESRLELILHCLSTPEPTICLEQLDWSGISPDELAAILDSERIAFIDKAIIISILFKSIGPRESGFFFDTAIQMMSGPPSAHYRLFESAMGILSSTDPAWVHWFLNGLVPGDLFFEDGTGLMIMVLNPVENLPDTLWEMMKEGGLGEWGGEGEQVNLAFSASIRHLIYTTPESALEYAKEAIQSMSMSDEAAVSMAQSAVFYASVLARKHPEVDSLALEELLTALLTSPNTELPAAVQFVSLFKDQPFPGLRAGVSDRYLREAMAIVERR